MTRAHSNDLRERVVRAHLAGEPIRSVAARYGVSVSSVPKWVARWRATGSVAPDKIGGHRNWLLEPHRDLVRALLGETPHLTIDRLQDLLAAQSSGSCRPTPQTSTRSNRPSQRSSTGCATPRSAPPKTPGTTSELSSIPSNPTNAATTSITPDTLPSKTDTL